MTEGTRDLQATADTIEEITTPEGLVLRFRVSLVADRIMAFALDLLVIALIAGAVALAIWLFARPGEEDEEAVPDYLASPLKGSPAEQPKNAFERARARIRDAIHQGRKASRDAQREQEQRFRRRASRAANHHDVECDFPPRTGRSRAGAAVFGHHQAAAFDRPLARAGRTRLQRELRKRFVDASMS